MFTIIGVDGKEYGPVTADQIRQWISENRLTPAMQARREGETEWRRLGEFAEFAPPAAVPMEATAIPPSPDDAGFAAPAPSQVVPQEPQPVVFTGDAGEYFKIWIVNVLLTIVTLGIYAAWAKVRKRRYFYAHTRVLGHAFEYLADPVKILYGNLIVGGLFLCLTLSQVVSPFLYLALVLLFSIAAPWFIVRALAFNARNTAWRGLRFNFTGKYGGAAMAFLLWPMMVPFTMGLLMPVVAQKQKDFMVRHHAFGTTPFAFAGKVEAFFKIYGVAVLFFLPVIAAYFGFIALMVYLGVQAKGNPGQRLPTEQIGLYFGLFMVVAVPAAFVGIQYFRARMFNLVWNHSTLAGTRFIATLRFRDLLLVEFVNKLVVALTIGFMFPWAAIRSAKLRADAVKVVPAGDPDAFVAAAQPAVGAVGDSANDFFNFDIGFGA